MTEAGIRNLRRSTRVLAQIPVIVSSVRTEGAPFEAPAETVLVSKHGAKIQTSVPLREGMYLRITVPSARRSQLARVARVEPRAPTTAEVAFGIELEQPENFWGVYFPPKDWEDPTSWEEAETLPVTELPEAAAGAPLPSPAAAPAAVDFPPLEVPAAGTEVFVRGISVARLPFQERSLLCPLDDYEATVLVRPVVDIGVLVQIIFPASGRALKAHTSGVGERREGERWRMWVKFIQPIRRVRP